MGRLLTITPLQPKKPEMRRTTRVLVACAVAMFLTTERSQAAPLTLQDMNVVTEWTDYENQLSEMPGFVWGNSDALLADRVGLYVEFANGLVGSITYSGVSGLWNTADFAGLTADTATGFFTGASGLHFLFNSSVTTEFPAALPMAWMDFVMPYSGNFDLDYNNQLGSNFRADVQGWGSAVFTTYSSTAPAAPVPEPASLSLLALGLAGVGAHRWRHWKA